MASQPRAQSRQGAITDAYFLTPTGPGMWEKNHWVVTLKTSASCIQEAKKGESAIPESFTIDANIETHRSKRISGSYSVTKTMTDGKTTTTQEDTVKYP